MSDPIINADIQLANVRLSEHTKNTYHMDEVLEGKKISKYTQILGGSVGNYIGTGSISGSNLYVNTELTESLYIPESVSIGVEGEFVFSSSSEDRIIGSGDIIVNLVGNKVLNITSSTISPEASDEVLGVLLSHNTTPGKIILTSDLPIEEPNFTGE